MSEEQTEIEEITSSTLEEMLGDIRPNYVTPHLSEVTSQPNNKKAKVLASFIMQGMVDSLKEPVQREIIHNGEIHSVRYVNIEPLLDGPWATISLLLLSLSYGEQSTIIEALYPPRLQLNAKSFAVIFTPELKQTTITLKQDDKLMDELKIANVGIAHILAIVKTIGTIPHADEIRKNLGTMRQIAHDGNKRDGYKKAIDKSQDANKHQDQQKGR